MFTDLMADAVYALLCRGSCEPSIVYFMTARQDTSWQKLARRSRRPFDLNFGRKGKYSKILKPQRKLHLPPLAMQCRCDGKTQRVQEELIPSEEDKR